MYNTFKINEDLTYIGGSDRRIALFENAYPVPDGVSYNSYFLDDEKTVLFDTVDSSVSGLFFDNLKHVLAGRKLDIVIVNHMEPDHRATLGRLIEKYPDVTVYTTAQAKKMMGQFFDFEKEPNVIPTKEGMEISTGRHELVFYTAPMVHWPEVMVTYDKTRKILFSADAFGTFGTLDGNIFSSKTDHWTEHVSRARRYYTNIVGKYGPQVQAALKKAGGLDISMICPLHGPVLDEGIGDAIALYDKWSRYEPEGKGVLIAYASIYGGTELAANIVANKLAEKGLDDIKVYDVSKTHYSKIVAEAFRCKSIVFASSTQDANIFSSMEFVLTELKAKNFQNRKIAIIENGTWAPGVIKNMTAMFESMKNMEIVSKISIRSTVKESDLPAIEELCEAVFAAVND